MADSMNRAFCVDASWVLGLHKVMPATTPHAAGYTYQAVSIRAILRLSPRCTLQLKLPRCKTLSI